MSETVSNEKWEELYSEFEKDYELAKKNNKTFQELIKTLIEEKHINSTTFCDKTTLDKMAFSRIKSKNYIPKMKTLITFCVAFDLDMLMTLTLLDSLALGFKRTNKTHYAYCYLITNQRTIRASLAQNSCSEEFIYKCNDYLEAFGVGKKIF